MFSSASAGEKLTFPEDGLTNRAAIRSSVLFPEPFLPASATHPCHNLSRDTHRNAYKPPYLLSIFSNLIVIGRTAAGVKEDPRGKTIRARSATHEIAEHFFRPRALLRILFFGNRAGLPSQFHPEVLIF
jgi:hypothetical protein